MPDQSEFARQLKIVLRDNDEPFLDALMLYGKVRLGISKTSPLFGDLKDSGHQDGASYLFILKDAAINAGSVGTGKAVVPKKLPGGDLYISASVDGADIYIDGTVAGLSPLVVKGLATDRTIKVSARFGELGGSAEISIVPGRLNELALKLERMKGNLVVVSTEKQLTVALDGKFLGAFGTGLFRDLDAGEHLVELRGEGLYARSMVDIRGEATTRIEPLLREVGSIVFDFPVGANVAVSSSTGDWMVSASGTMDDISAGDYSVSARIGSYSDSAILKVLRGQVASYLLAAPASIRFEGIPSNVEAIQVGDRRMEVSGRQVISIDGIRPNEAIPVTIFAGARSVQLLAETEAGKTTIVRIPAGRIVFDWLPHGSMATLDGLPIKLSDGPLRSSQALLAASYGVLVSMPGLGNYVEPVTIRDGSDARVTGQVDYAKKTLDRRRAQAQRSSGIGKGFAKAAWFAGATGLLAAAASGITWYLGNKAHADYLASNNPTDTLAARQSVELFQNLFVGSASLGAAGIGLGSIFAIVGSNQARLQKSIDSLDAQLKDIRHVELSRILASN